jgi:hypothetical protein
MRYLLSFVLMGLLFGGCAAPTEQMKKLQAENSQLKTDLSSARQNIATLEDEKTTLIGEVNRLTRISGTLEEEKAVRVEESSQLRQGVRGFLRSQMNAFREFSKNEDFLDYRGGELIQRSGQPNIGKTLIDTRYRINADGTLFGIRGDFGQPTRLGLAVLREVTGQWVVVWNTALLDVQSPGLQQVDFPVPVSVRKGDLVAFLFQDKVPVACDQGTGGIVPFDQTLKAGQKLTKATLGSHQGWACSIGVVGILGD